MASFRNFLFVFCVLTSSLLNFSCNVVPLVGASQARPHGQGSKPNIIFALIDDLGYHNLGFRNSEVLTPYIDSVKEDGLLLDRYYTYRYCSPSRSSFLSGRFPYHVNQFNNPENNLEQGGGIHVNMTLIAKKLKDAGYATHHIGKWHCGFSAPELIPSARGFDSSFGYFSGEEDHYNQTVGTACNSSHSMIDLFNTTEPAFGVNGTYGGYLYQDEAIRIIEAHDPDQPLFMYLAWQINHNPLEVPAEYLQLYSHVNDSTRQAYEAMTSFLDSAFNNVTNALKTKGLWENTLLVVSSDNGGPSGTDADSCNNYPLRGGKYSDFEGGVRINGIVSGPVLPEYRHGQTMEQFMHMVDWYATFCFLAGADPSDDIPGLPGVDSVNAWSLISGESSSPIRSEIPLSFGGQPGSGGGLIVGDYKILFGVQSPAIFNGPNYPNGTRPTPISIDCGSIGCLFNIMTDPTEHVDLASSMPELVTYMTNRFKTLNESTYQTPFVPADCSSATLQDVIKSGFWSPYGQIPYPVPQAANIPQDGN